MGCLMKNGIATSDGSLSHEYYVLQINGRVNSTHQRYEDAVLLLKYQFPRDDIKVREIISTEEVMQGTVLH
jgi:hypothetical protein